MARTFALGLLLALVGCSGSSTIAARNAGKLDKGGLSCDEEVPAGAGAIHGVITARGDRRELPQVAVIATPNPSPFIEDNANRRTAASDRNGCYFLATPVHGRHTVELVCGRTGASKSASIRLGQITRVDFTLDVAGNVESCASTD